MAQMEFLKKRTIYENVFTKEQAMKELKKDRRVKSIRLTKNCMIIDTKPILPTWNEKQDKELYLYPIGTYTITIRFGDEYQRYYMYKLFARIRRKEGAISNGNERSFHAPHIMSDWDICWGNGTNQMNKIRDNGDWYWYAMRCLDLLETGRPEDSVETLKYFMLRLQMSYLRQNKHPRLYKKVRAVFKKWWDYYGWNYSYTNGRFPEWG